MWTIFVIIPLILWLFFGAGAAKGWLRFCVIIVILFVGIIFMIGFSGEAMAHAKMDKPISTWQCEDITLTSDMQPDHKLGMGTVTVSGHTFEADVYRAGLDVRWNFSESFTIVMNRDNSAGYFDFDGAKKGQLVDPLESFQCELQ